MRRSKTLNRTSIQEINVKLTQKDLEFIQRLKGLFEENNLSIELKQTDPKTIVLRKNYGMKIERAFGTTRQGIRWRFQRLLNDIYVSAYETIYWIESTFGPSLRSQALEIAKERVTLRKRVNQANRSYRPK